MGRSYYVPRSVKGESRILIIFTLRSFVFTAVFGIIGFMFAELISSIISMGILAKVITAALFGGVGYVIGAVKIPDSPIVGTFRKASGEYIYAIIWRFFTFKGRKKIYIYNYDRGMKSSKQEGQENTEDKKSTINKLLNLGGE